MYNCISIFVQLQICTHFLGDRGPGPARGGEKLINKFFFAVVNFFRDGRKKLQSLSRSIFRAKMEDVGIMISAGRVTETAMAEST